jgi:hypothetical protein
MAKPEQQTEMWSCIAPFSVWVGSRPEVYAAGTQVRGDDPILKTHRSHFQHTQVRAPAGGAYPIVETATAAPGEVRAPVRPVTVKP